jgi:hypothetical protein
MRSDGLCRQPVGDDEDEIATARRRLGGTARRLVKPPAEIGAGEIGCTVCRRAVELERREVTLA